MSIIQTIRDKYAKVAGGVVVLALVGFIVGGTDPNTIFGSSNSVGTINGTEIDYVVFDAAVANTEKQYKTNNNVTNIDEQTSARLRDQTWNQLVSENVLNAIYKELGITVSKKELNDLLTGEKPDPAIVQAFTNPQTGQFNAQEAAAQIADIRRNPEMKAQWEAFENDIIKRRYFTKLNSMVAGAIYVPKFIVDADDAERNSYANVNYVQLPFSLIPDDQVKPTDEELKQYITNHPASFQQKEASRSVEIVTFEVKPNTEDSAKVFNDFTTIIPDFQAKNDEELNQFISLNSDQARMVNYYTKEQLASLPNSEAIWNGGINEVVGPFPVGDNFMITKITEKQNLPDSVKVRHILVKTEDRRQPAQYTDEAAKARIDSVVALANAGVAFDSLVTVFSEDQGSLQTKGEYTFSLENKAGISKEFGDFAFTGQPGEKKVVKVSNDGYSGYHYIEIISQGAPKAVVKLAIIDKELSPSSEAFTSAYNDATQFLGEAKDAATFDATAQKMNASILPIDFLLENSSLVQGLGASRDLVKWAYTAKDGDISNIITVGDKYIVARLTGVQEKGLMSLNEGNRASLEQLVRKEKKAKLLIEKNKANASLEAIASANTQEVGYAADVNLLQGFIPNVGNEPRPVGYMFYKNLKEGTLSPGIIGNNAVFYINVVNRTVRASEQPRNIAMERKMLEAQIKANATNAFINSLMNQADVEDTRSKFF